MGGFNFRLMPRQERFFQMFDRSAANVLEGARALRDLLDDFTDVERKVRRLKDLEHAGDQITHEIFQELDRSFVTPIDRDDVTRLAGALDDVLDGMEEAARRLRAYKIPAPTPLAVRFGHILDEQAQGIARAMPVLPDEKRAADVRRDIVELHRLENEADDLLTTALETLYDGVSSVPEVVRAVQWRDVYELLEEATDRGEQVGTALESILIKRG